MQKYKHVIQYFTQFTFKLTIKGERVLPGAWWPTKSSASFYAEFSKWYLRQKFGLDHHTVHMAYHYTPESLIAEATQRGIDTSTLDAAFEYLPKGIKAHIERHSEELAADAALNLNQDFQKAVASVVAGLTSIVSCLRRGIERTDGPHREFLERSLAVFEKDADTFADSAVKAIQPTSV